MPCNEGLSAPCAQSSPPGYLHLCVIDHLASSCECCWGWGCCCLPAGRAGIITCRTFGASESHARSKADGLAAPSAKAARYGAQKGAGGYDAQKGAGGGGGKKGGKKGDFGKQSPSIPKELRNNNKLFLKISKC